MSESEWSSHSYLHIFTLVQARLPFGTLKFQRFLSHVSQFMRCDSANFIPRHNVCTHIGQLHHHKHIVYIP